MSPYLFLLAWKLAENGLLSWRTKRHYQLFTVGFLPMKALVFDTCDLGNKDIQRVKGHLLTLPVFPICVRTTKLHFFTKYSRVSAVPKCLVVRCSNHDKIHRRYASHVLLAQVERLFSCVHIAREVDNGSISIHLKSIAGFDGC